MVTSVVVPTSQVGAVVVLVVLWVARALPPAPGTAVLAGMAAELFGTAPWGGNNWHGHDHDHFVHDHDHFRNRFIAVGGWWPGYYGYGYGYGGCSWLYDQAVYTGSSYWWNRYYACASYY